MTNLSIQVDGYVSPFASQLPKVNVSDIIYVEKFEEDAYGHWLFGIDANSLIDKVNARNLTLQSGATVAPVYSDKYLQLGAAKGQSLQSGMIDSASTGYTISGVVHPESTDLMVMLGNLSGNDITPVSGAGLFLSANKVFATGRTGVSSLDSGIILDPTKPVFISMSVNKSSNELKTIAMQNGVIVEKSATGVQVDSGTALSIGNSRYTTGSAYNALKNKYFEVIIHDKALTLSEMKAVANRAYQRQKHRGLDF